MSPLNIVLAVISVISFVLAVFSFVRTEIKKANEQAKIEIMREKLKNLYHALVAVLDSSNAIVQIPKARQASVEELQDLARITRGQVLVLLKGIGEYGRKLGEWKFGVMIPSGPLEQIQFEEQKADQPGEEESLSETE